MFDWSDPVNVFLGRIVSAFILFLSIWAIDLLVQNLMYDISQLFYDKEKWIKYLFENASQMR